jgi:glycogen phosphorylase
MLYMHVVYITPELALPAAYPVYAGGLGITVADYIRELSTTELTIDATIITLLYTNGYSAKNIGGGLYTPSLMGLTQLTYSSGVPVELAIPIANGELKTTIWMSWQKKTPIYYLWCEDIAQDVYPLQANERLQQQIVLGVGAYMLCKLLNLPVDVYHINEPHSMCLLMAKELVQDTKPVLFTSHSLQTSQYEVYDSIALQRVFAPTYRAITMQQNATTFNSMEYCIAKSTLVNGVSNFHAEAMQNAYNKQFTHVTNGIYTDYWDSVGNTETVVSAHKKNKKRLIDNVNKTYGANWQESDIILGWARGLSSNKNPSELLEMFLMLKKYVSYPVRFVFSGNARPKDEYGQNIKHTLAELSKLPDQNSIMYFAGYDSPTTSMMVSGCDVWVNVPKPDTETCGTSGMKAALNGTLLCVSEEGWLQGVDIPTVGFKVDKQQALIDIVHVLKDNILPIFYEQKDVWQEMQKSSRATILKNHTTKNMLDGYLKLYAGLVVSLDYCSK